MSDVLTSAQMRAIEQAAVASGTVTGLELMERAGRGVVAAVFAEWPDLAATPHRAVVLCGPGNNGGDGFVVARLLKEWGWEVAVFLYGDAGKLPPDARVNHDRWKDMGEVARADDLMDRLRFPQSDAEHPDFDLFIDAVFGTGLTRPVPDEIVRIARSLNNRDNPRGDQGWIVSVDIPSGLCADSGKILGHDQGAVFRSDMTVSFHTRKVGHLLQDGPIICGKSVVASIGLGGSPRPRVGVRPPPRVAVGGCPAVPPGDVVHLVDGSSIVQPGKSVQTHKYTHGHALILSGGAGHTGAARLAARGALRIGAGVVTLGVPGAAQHEVARQITALMLRRIEDGNALAEALNDKRINALCLGPGMGIDRACDLVPVALHHEGAPRVVLDADALTAFSDAPAALFDLLHGNCVLTPHAGEFARLFPDIAAKLDAPPAKGPAYSKVDATRAAAARAGSVVLFKGPDTVIAAPDGRCAINSAHYDRAAPWLATAGSGDVLAGFITGLMARGFAPMQAAQTAAWLHVEAARAFGPGLIAEDLPETLPAVLRALSG